MFQLFQRPTCPLLRDSSDYLYKKQIAMENKKRQFRELSNDTKQKISNASKGRPKSQSHRQHISQAMTDYWKTIPHRPTPSDNPSPTESGQIV